MQSFSNKRTWGPTPRYPMVEAYAPPHTQKLIVIAGPCSVESVEMIHGLALKVKAAGATHLRGGVFKAGTYPGPFGYRDESILNAFHVAAKTNDLENIIEVLDYTTKSLDMAAKYCTAFQVGARSQQNYSLLRKLGEYDKPVFLKRNTGSTVDEWLGSAEHLLVGGVKEIFLIERGSSTFHNDVRWTPCVHTIPSVKSICDVPVIIDAAHGTGRRDLVGPVTLAGIAAGAAGLLIEVHETPEQSLSDADQALTPSDFNKLMNRVKLIKAALL